MDETVDLEPPDRILTVPNAISFVRLCCIPWFLVLLFGQDNRHAAAWLLAVLGCTDWVDGYIARRWNQVARRFQPMTWSTSRIRRRRTSEPERATR